MKSGQDHIVPLSKQSIALIEEQIVEVKNLNTIFVFPSQYNHRTPMCNNTVRLALVKFLKTG
jgi:integrase